jgi:hypothetical protein
LDAFEGGEEASSASALRAVKTMDNEPIRSKSKERQRIMSSPITQDPIWPQLRLRREPEVLRIQLSIKGKWKQKVSH